MSRRMDREGIGRSEPQRIQNQRFRDDPRCKADAKGWLQPFANWQGWDNHAIYALRCVIIWKSISLPAPSPLLREDGTYDRAQMWRGSTLARIESDLRGFHFHISRSRKCDRPVLP